MDITEIVKNNNISTADDFINFLSAGELSYCLSRYCGAHNLLLYEKFIMPHFRVSEKKFSATAQRVLLSKLIEEGLGL